MNPSRIRQQLDWRDEREKLLHRAMTRINRAVEGGKPIGSTIRRVAWSLNGHSFRCDPSRKLRLSRQTLRRLWDASRGGRVPDALRLHYRTPRRVVASGPVSRFINFCLDHEFSSLAAALRSFNQRRGGKARALGYDTMLRNLPQGFAANMRQCHRAEREASRLKARTRMAALAYVQTRVPARLETPATFEI